MPLYPQIDYFSSLPKGAGLYEQEITSNDISNRETLIDHEVMDNKIEEDSFDTRKFMGQLPPLAEVMGELVGSG